MATINGTDGNDTLTDTTGDDTINLLAGDDTITFTGGEDTINLGDGNDTIIQLAFGPYSVTDGGGFDTLDMHLLTAGRWVAVSDIERVIGSAFDDTISASANFSPSYQFFGGGGSDSLYGEAGVDLLVGGTGNDRLEGKLGTDTYRWTIGDGNDVVYDTGGALDTIEFDYGIAPANIRFETGPYNLVLVHVPSGARITLQDQHNAAANVIELLVFAGGEMIDLTQGSSFTGTASGEALYGGLFADTLDGGGGNDTLLGKLGNDTLYGGSEADRLEGGDGNDDLTGGTGNDTLRGDLGNDTYRWAIGDGADSILEAGGTDNFVFGRGILSTDIRLTVGSSDLVVTDIPSNTSITFSGQHLDIEHVVERLTFANGSVIDLTAGYSFSGTASGETLYGGLFNDSIWAGAGRDFVYGRNGNDTLLGEAGDDVLNGDDGDDYLQGGSGNDMLQGWNGADRMEGGADDDTYYVDNAGDRVNEKAGEGTDEVFAGITFELGANVENLTLFGNDNTNGAGNALANVLTGNAGNNWLVALAGNDTIDGGLGADRMEGGSGDDTYYVDSVLDRPTERVGEGIDLVLSSVSFELGANVENLTLLGGANLNGGGNALANVLTGNGGNNWLVALAGNDTIDGGLGSDRMEGGVGDDTYYVDNGSDRVTEKLNEGTDQVFSSLSFELGINVEKLTLTGNANLSGAGNSLANALTGNAGNNWLVGSLGNDVLDGGLGIDRMEGGADNDTYYVDNASDRATEKAGEGTDTVFASVSYELGAEVENLTLTGSGNSSGGGNALANVLTGNSGANWLVGLAGNDVLDGGLGADKLDGGADQDTFAFTTALGGGNIDRITGFVAADDTIQLENAVFTGLAAGALAAGAFNTGAAATQADDRIIYNGNTGALLFDVDGLGGAAGVQFATLSADLTLTSADFLVI